MSTYFTFETEIYYIYNIYIIYIVILYIIKIQIKSYTPFLENCQLKKLKKLALNSIQLTRDFHCGLSFAVVVYSCLHYRNNL